MRRSGARAGQWPHRSTSLAHFKSLQAVLKGFHMPYKSTFSPSYYCTWKMDTVKNFLFESILPFKKTVVNIPCSQNCTEQQSVGGVHPDKSSGTTGSSRIMGSGHFCTEFPQDLFQQ